jgi:hypothetical protein
MSGWRAGLFLSLLRPADGGLFQFRISGDWIKGRTLQREVQAGRCAAASRRPRDHAREASELEQLRGQPHKPGMANREDNGRAGAGQVRLFYEFKLTSLAGLVWTYSVSRQGLLSASDRAAQELL